MIERLLEKGELYRETQILIAFYSSRLEGMTVTREEVEKAFDQEWNTELSKNFILFDYMLKTYQEPLSEELIREYHRKLGETGEYRVKDTVRGLALGCIPAEEVPEAMESLISDFSGYKATLTELAEFHARMRKIDPFEYKSGSVARIILYKECLSHNKTPIVVFDRVQPSAYSISLATYEENPAKFIKALSKMRDIYSKIIKATL